MDCPGIPIDTKENEDPLLIRYSVVKAANEVFMYSIKSEPTCNSETYITSCVSEHEMISVKEENTSMVTVGKTEHENSMDFMKHEPGLCSESCPALVDENQVMNVKVEDLLAVEGEEGPLPVAVASINIKQELCWIGYIFRHIRKAYLNNDSLVTLVHWVSPLHETARLPTAQSRDPTFFIRQHSEPFACAEANCGSSWDQNWAA